MLVARLAVGLAGALLVGFTVLEAVRTVLVPRPLRVVGGRLVFVGLRRAFELGLRLGRVRERAARDRVMAHWAPVSLIALPALWLALVGLGFAALLWAVDGEGARRAVVVSGSSLLTLGFAAPGGFPATLLAFAEAGVGVALLALVISYLPTIYGAIARREAVVAMLDARAGQPPSAVALLVRAERYAGIERLDRYWAEWERWVADVGESHTTHAMLSFFRSSDAGRSWVTAIGAMLDAANLRMAAIDATGPGNHDAWMFIQAGTRALREVAAFYGLPLAAEACSVGRPELEGAIDELAAAGLPIVPDTDAAWTRFAARRAEYDAALLGLAALVDAAPAPWSSDRAPALAHLPPIVRRSARR